jgi:hypothetical protein
MVHVTDNITYSAFYIAADEWTRKPNEEWRVTKAFGAFHDAASFVKTMLEKSKARCFYKIIRQDRPYKAYMDLEAEARAISAEQGRAMCDAPGGSSGG